MANQGGTSNCAMYAHVFACVVHQFQPYTPTARQTVYVQNNAYDGSGLGVLLLLGGPGLRRRPGRANGVRAASEYTPRTTRQRAQSPPPPNTATTVLIQHKLLVVRHALPVAIIYYHTQHVTRTGVKKLIRHFKWHVPCKGTRKRAPKVSQSVVSLFMSGVHLYQFCSVCTFSV